MKKDQWESMSDSHFVDDIVNEDDEEIISKLLERLEIYNDIMSKPFVQGRDLIEAGFEPNEKFSEYLDYAHKLRLAGVDKEAALKQTLAYARKKK